MANFGRRVKATYERLENHLESAVENLDAAYDESENLKDGDSYFLAEPYKVALSAASRSIAGLLDMLQGEKRSAMDRFIEVESRRLKGKVL